MINEFLDHLKSRNSKKQTFLEADREGNYSTQNVPRFTSWIESIEQFSSDIQRTDRSLNQRPQVCS